MSSSSAYLPSSLSLGDREVRIANVITRGDHGQPNITMLRLLRAGLTKIGGKGHPLQVSITAAEFAETFGLDIETSYRAMKLAEGPIQAVTLKIQRKDHKGKPVTESVVWVPTVKYFDGEARMEMKFNPDLLPYLVGLKSEFTKYRLKKGAALNSLYSWRLLELLAQFRESGWLHISIDDLFFTLRPPETYRANFKDLRRQIIEPAVAELLAKSGYSKIEWEPIRQGRKVAALRFEFEETEQPEAEQGTLPL